MSQENSTPPEEDRKNWYKKSWCVILFLIIFYPLGLILLWLSPRGSVQIKVLITIVIFYSVVHFDVGNSFLTRVLYPPQEYTHTINRSADSYNDLSKYQGSSNEEGYLKSGAEWLDGKGNLHRNTKKVKVEIGTQKVVAADGNLTQIYFLEGEYSGTWGYTPESSISR